MHCSKADSDRVAPLQRKDSYTFLCGVGEGPPQTMCGRVVVNRILQVWNFCASKGLDRLDSFPFVWYDKHSNSPSYCGKELDFMADKEWGGTLGTGTNEAVLARTKGKNLSHPGRKKALSPADLEEVDNLHCNGMRVNEIASKFKVCRATISSYLNRRPSYDYTLRIDFRQDDKTCTVIFVDFLHEHIVIENHTSDIFQRAFGVVEHPTWEDFQDFLESRCVPRTRGGVKKILRDLGINSGYDPLAIAEAVGGRTAEDKQYMAFRVLPKNRKRAERYAPKD